MSNKKVILINGTSSNWYEQAIFILKQDNESKVPINLVNEAEKIINEYMLLKCQNKNSPLNIYTDNFKNNVKNTKTNIKKSRNSLNPFNFILNISIITCVVLIAILLYKICF